LRIARVVKDDGGDDLLVVTDGEVEGEAAAEYGFKKPEPQQFWIPRSAARIILE
jgi:hypothetical protein